MLAFDQMSLVINPQLLYGTLYAFMVPHLSYGTTFAFQHPHPIGSQKGPQPER
jgi:hypothetical protein